MFKKICILTLALAALASLLAAGLALPAAAAPLPQAQIYTPTPLPDGRIIYIVQPNDTLIRISLISGVPLDKLRALNNLTGDNIAAGQSLLLGLAGPALVTPTAGPTPTPTPVLPTPSPKPGSGKLCVLFFDDQNGDSIRQESEPSIPGGAINISNRSGSVSLTENTRAGSDPVCFEQLAEGDYAVSVAVPTGYNPTTETSFNLNLRAGDTTYLDFGAQVNSETLAEAPTPTGSGRSPLLGIIGGVFLLAGAALAIFAGKLIRNS